MIIKKNNKNPKKELLSNNENEEKEKLHYNVINNIDILIEELLDQGVKFYKLSFLEEISKIKIAFIEVEDTINYCMMNISMIEFIYLTIEKETSGNFTIHCILATRTLLNGNILYSIKNLFNQLNEAIEINYLEGYNCVKENWIKILNQKNYNFHRFVYFSKFHQKTYTALAELEATFYPECGYGLSFIDNALDSNIKGISGEKNSKEKTCLNLLNLFLCINEFRLIYDGIYVKINKSKFSYIFFDNIDYFDLNNFKIFNDLKKKFPQQLKKLDITDLLLCCWENLFENILKKKKNYFLFGNDVGIYYENLIEFNNGLYFLDYDYFFDFEENKSVLFDITNIICYKYFDESFENIKLFPPKDWLNEIKKSFVYDNENIFSFIGLYFNSKIIAKENKKEAIIFRNYDDFTMIVNFSLFNSIEEANNETEKLFFIDQKEDKKFIVCNLISLIDKNKKTIGIDKYLSNIGNIKFIFNEKLPDKMLKDRIFFIKLIIYTFTFVFCKNTNFIKLESILNRELAKIILYCNSFNFFEKKKGFSFKDLLLNK